MSLASFINFLNFLLNLRASHSNLLYGNVHERVYMYLVSHIIAALTSNLQQVVACFSPTAELQGLEI